MCNNFKEIDKSENGENYSTDTMLTKFQGWKM